MPPSDRPGDAIDMDFLLPTGFLVTMSCDRKCKLGDLKVDLWREAVKLPAASQLRNSDSYVFFGVTEDAVEKQFDDSLKVQDLNLILPILEVSIPDRDAIRLDNAIGEAIGFPTKQLERISSADIRSFRRDVQPMCMKLAEQRKAYTREELALFLYPPRLDINQDLPMYLANKIEKDGCRMTVKVWIVDESCGSTCYTLDTVSPLDTPSKVVMATIRYKYSQRGHPTPEVSAYAERGRDLFRLKVGGRQEYLLRECMIHMYAYIRDCLSRDTVPHLQLVHKQDLHLSPDTNHNYDINPSTEEWNREPSPPCVPTIATWEISEAYYCIKVHHAKGARSCLSGNAMNVKAQLYHGTQPLCPPLQTQHQGWNQTLRFPVLLQCLPRCTQLCFALCGVNGRARSVTSQYWVNIQVFDKDGALQTGKFELGMWPAPRSQWGSTMFPQGPPGSNDNGDVPTLVFSVKSPRMQRVVYPPDDVIDDKLPCPTEIRQGSISRGNRSCARDFRVLDGIVAKDPVRALKPSEKKFLWDNRELCLAENPELLPRLLQCVDWLDRHQVVEIYGLIKHWSVEQMTLTTALLLLDTSYPDVRVRSLAVRCLERHISDEFVLLYMMQLVQVLKFDCYIHSPLCRFLLSKALMNWTIGKKLFWNLRADLQNPTSRNWFAPILEAYCRFCGPVLNFLLQDVRGLNCCINTAKAIKSESSHVNLKDFLINSLSQEDESNSMTTLPSVIDLGLLPGPISPEKSDVMSSKMKPLWLDWPNNDPLAAETNRDRIRLIFKAGDDLRQDMLVLQMLKLIDMFYKYTKEDLRMTPYECVAMGRDVGLIEVVPNASTVADIIRILPDRTMLHSWLHEHNKDRYDSAVRDFTTSCAAYCVATYILGVSDRHPGNIMVTKDGRLLHIDFGHILNNRKNFGVVKRERVPFILTKDFMQVITKGRSEGQQNPFHTAQCQEFIYLCFKCYLTVRRNSSLLITLFKLMIHSELPELSCRAHLDQLRETLAVEKSDADAGKDFLMKLGDSYSGSWTTTVDWFFHKLNHMS